MREMGGAYAGDGPKLMGGGIGAMTYAGLAPAVATDPPFNIGYRYKGFTDRMDGGDRYAMLAGVTAKTAAVVIRYPEQPHRPSIEKGEAPERAAGVRPQHRKAAPGRGLLRCQTGLQPGQAAL